MKRIVLGLLACLLFLQINSVTAAEWLTDMPKAVAQAKAEHKMVFVDFTGSDWCGWCKKFKAEVLTQPEFTTYAAKNLVLVELDYPHKIAQSAELKQANKALSIKYGVDGFPTLLLLNADGKELGRQGGYSKGGPAAFIAKLEKWKKQ